MSEPTATAPAPRGIFLTMPMWPDTGEPTVRVMVESMMTICVDKEATGFAHMLLEPNGHMVLLRVEARK